MFTQLIARMLNDASSVYNFISYHIWKRIPENAPKSLLLHLVEKHVFLLKEKMEDKASPSPEYELDI